MQSLPPRVSLSLTVCLNWYPVHDMYETNLETYKSLGGNMIMMVTCASNKPRFLIKAQSRAYA